MDRQLINYFTSPQKTIEERFEAGKALREKFPRIDQGDFVPAANRTDPIAILETQAKTRVPELVPIRHARMLTSSFAFLRGGAAIMASDLAANNKTTGITVQTCGDLHVANFGIFASAEHNLIFGINDFDETLPGPWEWDLKRLVTSIVTSGKFLGADKQICEDAVKATVKSYREKMRKFASMGNLELWYSTIREKDIFDAMPASARAGAERIIQKAKGSTNMQVLEKLTDLVDEKYRLLDDAPFIVHETHTEQGTPIQEALGKVLESYFASISPERKNLLKHYRIVDVARKVVGVGSVGTRCWIIFLKGNHDNDPLFLQIKEAEASVLESFIPKSIYKSHGRRVVEGQRLIQGAPDIFLGWGEQEGKHFYIRQLRDMKGGIEFDPEKVKVKNMPAYGALCAWSLALAHAKSGDAAMIAGYVGKSEVLDDVMVRFAFAYDQQNEKDYATFKDAIKIGRLKATIAE